MPGDTGYTEHTVEPEAPAGPPSTITLRYADGTTSGPLAYDGVIMPPSYLKILQGDHVYAVHERHVDGFELHQLDPRSFGDLE